MEEISMNELAILLLIGVIALIVGIVVGFNIREQ